MARGVKLGIAIALFGIAGGLGWWRSGALGGRGPAPTDPPVGPGEAAAAIERLVEFGAPPPRGIDGDEPRRTRTSEAELRAAARNASGLTYSRHAVVGSGLSGLAPVEDQSVVRLALGQGDLDPRTPDAAPGEDELASLDTAIAAVAAWLGGGPASAMLGSGFDADQIEGALDAWRDDAMGSAGGWSMRVQPASAPGNPTDIDLERPRKAEGLLAACLEALGLSLESFDPSAAPLVAGARVALVDAVFHEMTVEIDLVHHATSNRWALLSARVGERSRGRGWSENTPRLLWPRFSRELVLFPADGLASVAELRDKEPKR